VIGRRTLLRLCSCIALGALLALPGCGSDSGESPPHQEPPGLLFAQVATGGTLERGGDGITLTLRGIDPGTIFFSDRPERNAGQLPNAAFVDMWDAAGFTEDPPNAALTIAGAPPSADVFVVELSDPRLVDGRRGIAYTATPVKKVGITSAEERMDPLRNAPATFRDSSLLIDDVPPTDAATAAASKLARSADSLPDPGGSARLSSLLARLQDDSQRSASLTSQLSDGSSRASAIEDLERLQASMAARMAEINALIEKLRQSADVDPSAMFQLQVAMQTMSQLLEASSNLMSALNQATMSNASSVKGG
jgi:hypothetical protein